MNRRAEPEQSMVRERKARKPIGTVSVLDAAPRPGFHRRYVNDDPGRVQRFIEAGYEPVRDPSQNQSRQESSALGDSIIRQHVGGGKTAVLMEIPDEWHAEDQAAKAAVVDRTEEGLRGPQAEGHYGKVRIGTSDY